MPGTRSAFFERVTGGYYLDFEPKREQAARYNLTVGQLNEVVESAIGGKNVTTTVEGRERYPVNVRYARGLRDNLSSLSRVLVPTPDGAQVPLIELADITVRTGAPMIKNEEGFKAGFLYVDTTSRDMGGYVEAARRAVQQQVKLPAGYQLIWSGQYEYLERGRERLWAVIPITLFIVFLLLYFNTGSLTKTIIILLAVPFFSRGALTAPCRWLLWASSGECFRDPCLSPGSSLRFSATLSIGSAGIQFASKRGKDSRTWLYRDIQTIGTSDPFHFRVTSYAETFTFDLKERLPKAAYDLAWQAVYGIGR